MKIPMTVISNIVYALRYAKSFRGWVVIVCPNVGTKQACARVLSGAIPDDAIFSGRTAVLPKGGKISVASVAEKVFVPEGDDYSTLFIGWEAKAAARGMKKWYRSPSSILQAQ